MTTSICTDRLEFADFCLSNGHYPLQPNDQGWSGVTTAISKCSSESATLLTPGTTHSFPHWSCSSRRTTSRSLGG